jgi:hypothetical protein
MATGSGRIRPSRMTTEEDDMRAINCPPDQHLEPDHRDELFRLGRDHSEMNRPDDQIRTRLAANVYDLERVR